MNIKMKYTLFTFLIFVSLLFSNCSQTLKNFADNAIGADIEQLLQAEKLDNYHGYVNCWRDNNINKDYYLPNGNLVHVYPEKEGCLIHWEIDKNTNKIINYKFEGNECY
jgi:hypothetical protein